MKNTKKKVLSIVLSLFLMATSFSLAHSGRIDNSGGHHDNKNKSGLGSYHYHYGDNPAHLHENGVCLYSDTTTAKPSTEQSSSASNIVVVNSNNKSVYIPNYTIKINGKVVNNIHCRSPFFSYNNVVYLPLTWDRVRCLGLESEWDSSTGLKLTSSDKPNLNALNLPENRIPYVVNGRYTATKTNVNVYINGELLPQTEEYPFFNFFHITYIPLTSDNATKLGLQIEWNDQTGFSVKKKVTQ